MDHLTLARKLAEDSIVLLKNEENLLPLKRNASIALFGRTQIDPVFSGNGSGAARCAGRKNILTALHDAGLRPVESLAAFYEKQAAGELAQDPDAIDWEHAAELYHSGVIYEMFGKYHAPKQEPVVPEELFCGAASETDTAVLVLGRNSGGEECDRHLVEDYYLTKSEKQLVLSVCETFPNIVLVLNINGQIDLGWTEQYASLKSILFLGVPGEQGCDALANILVGEVNPSGRLAFTAARQYKDHPSALHFTFDKESDRILTYESYGLDAAANGCIGYREGPVTVYVEDIYAGYRYFDGFQIEPLFSFGYGLSYTQFEINCLRTARVPNGLLVVCEVSNRGKRQGKEVVQIYAAARNVDKPFPKRLAGFGKTRSLMPYQKEKLSVEISWEQLSRYDEETASWRIEAGEYTLLLGESVQHLTPISVITVKSAIEVQKVENRLGLAACNKGKMEWILQANTPSFPILRPVSKFTITEKDIARPKLSKIQPEEKDDPDKYHFSTKELAALAVGYGPGTAFSAFDEGASPSTIADSAGNPLTVNDHPAGYPGYVSPAIPGKGIHSIFYKDGPAGVGRTSWPTEMLLACSWNWDLLYAFGDAIGAECEREHIDVWLGPAVNLHRNPLCGRNFEYFSEDPFLTGRCATAIVRGVQENHAVLACPKHFAANEQETFRRGSTKKNINAADSILTERALRELYLEPFKMLVRDADIHCIMTSFNKINGVFAAGSYDLCTGILRDEWGFDGIVVTDWGDMDIVVDGADAVKAGNDIVMPGGPPVIRQFLQGLEDGRLVRKDLERSVTRLLQVLSQLQKFSTAEERH